MRSRAEHRHAAVEQRKVSPAAHTEELGDLRFRKTLSAEAWRCLPAAVRTRFSKRLSGANSAVYTGRIVETRMSALGWAIAQLARIIGAPLPTSRDTGVAAAVSVTEDTAGGGQCWTRVYGRHRGFPQVIHSAKRFAGPTGLEEYIGYGIGMALTVEAGDDGLRFLSEHYFVSLLGRRARLPRWLTPGRTIVSHIDLGSGEFAFVLDLTHPWFGELIHQRALFKDR